MTELENADALQMLLIGGEQTPPYLRKLYNLLLRAAVRYDLDIVQMEALSAWAFTATENPSQNISLATKMLMGGWKALESTTSNTDLLDIAMRATLELRPQVRVAAIIRRPGKPLEVIAHLH